MLIISSRDQPHQKISTLEVPIKLTLIYQGSGKNKLPLYIIKISIYFAQILYYFHQINSLSTRLHRLIERRIPNIKNLFYIKLFTKCECDTFFSIHSAIKQYRNNLQGEHTMDKKVIAVTLSIFFTACLVHATDTIKPLIYPKENIYPQSITFDGKSFWVLDPKARQIYAFDSEMKKNLKTFKTTFASPKCIAVGGSRLWIADENERKLFAVNMTNGKTEKSYPIEIPGGNDYKSMEGLAWGGTYLWLAVSAGFSGSFNQIDPESGKVLRSVYAECDPRGIASDGKFLWSICYNGKNMPSKIDKRPITEKESDMLNAREFILDIPLISPAGLLFDGKKFIINELASKKLLIIMPTRPKKKK